MSYKDTLDWLRRYRNSLRRQQMLGQELAQLRAMAEGLTRAPDSVPGGGGPGDRLQGSGNTRPRTWSTNNRQSRGAAAKGGFSALLDFLTGKCFNNLSCRKRQRSKGECPLFLGGCSPLLFV